jgi:hypothetical protein
LPNRESGSGPGRGCRAPESLWPRLPLSEIRLQKANLQENRGKPRHLGQQSGPLHRVNLCVGFPQRTISSLVRPRIGNSLSNSLRCRFRKKQEVDGKQQAILCSAPNKTGLNWQLKTTRPDAGSRPTPEGTRRGRKQDAR